MSKRVYLLVSGGEVLLDWSRDVEAVVPKWNGITGHFARVTTTSGTVYFVKGEHGIQG
jgi:hypothetical protein